MIEPLQEGLHHRKPTFSKGAPSGPEWIHEIKHDGYRLIVRKDGGRVRMFTDAVNIAYDAGMVVGTAAGNNFPGKPTTIAYGARRLQARMCRRRRLRSRVVDYRPLSLTNR